MELKTDKILAEAADGIGWVTFNNPARHNAIALEMWEGLGTILEHFQQDDSVRVVVMKGAGDKAFVSGADISEFGKNRSNVEQSKSYAQSSAHANYWLRKLDKPLIGMIQGYCIGGGLAVALNADVRFATPDSQFSIPATKLGVGYDFPGTFALARLVGPSQARDILFSARLLGAEEALRLGLINFLVEREELETRVVEYAETLAARAPLTVKLFKESLNQFERNAQDRDLELLKRLVNDCFESDDYAEGRKAFMEKRTPEFKGK